MKDFLLLHLLTSRAALPLFSYTILPRKRKPADEDSDTENEDDEDEDHGEVTASDDEEEEEADSSEEETEDDDDDDFQETKPSRKKSKMTSSSSGPRNGAPKKTKIQVGKSKSNKKSSSSSKNNAAAAKSASSSKQGRVNASLAALAKNVLPPNEEPGLKSLIAGLLSSYRPPKSTQVANFTSNVSLNVISPYTINLHSLAERVIGMHNENPNRAQLALLNLLFRSVGGTPDADLPMGGTTSSGADEMQGEEEEETNLETMDTEDWARVVTDLVDDMRFAPAQQILLCADPLGAVHQQNSHGDDDNDDEDEKKKGPKQYALGAAEFRKIYKEFWYILGYVALTEGGMATNTQQEEEETPGSVVRLDAELAKELIMRVIELSPVGQPDVRAGATLAAISMSHAVLDQSAQLVKKMDVAERQLQAAKKGKNVSKAEALKVRVDSLKRSAQDLQEVVMGLVVQGLLVHRYR